MPRSPATRAKPITLWLEPDDFAMLDRQVQWLKRQNPKGTAMDNNKAEAIRLAIRERDERLNEEEA